MVGRNGLNSVGMTLDGIELLQEVKTKSNNMFHNNNSLRETKMKLHDSIPELIKIYKLPLSTEGSILKSLANGAHLNIFTWLCWN